MPQSEAFQTFSSGCKRLLFSITNRQLTEKEARILQYYCRDILAKIAPSLPKPPATKADCPHNPKVEGSNPCPAIKFNLHVTSTLSH